MKLWLTVCLVCLFTAPGHRQATPAAPEHGVSFDFTPRPDAKQPAYIVSVNPQGEGRYIEFAAETPDGPAARPVLFQITTRTMQRLLSAHGAVLVRSQQQTCGARQKNIASTGRKVLTYYDGGKSVACDFDYSDDPALIGVADGFQAIAETLQFGDRLEHAHRFDRLSLDGLMDTLDGEKQQGRAIEMQMIAPALQSIVDDDRVMDRARRKAARLLQPEDTSPRLPGPRAQ